MSLEMLTAAPHPVICHEHRGCVPHPLGGLATVLDAVALIRLAVPRANVLTAFEAGMELVNRLPPGGGDGGGLPIEETTSRGGDAAEGGMTGTDGITRPIQESCRKYRTTRLAR